MRNRMKGVTLIELMIVVIVVGTLAAIAVPSYRSYVLRTHRAEAKTALLALAAAQEKHYVVNNTYAAAAVLSSAPPTGLGIAATTQGGWYTIAITAADAAGFTATATATGTQAADTACATFSINQAGVRSATGGNPTVCWN